MRSREPKRQLVEPVATRRQDRRKAILDAAESLFLDQGFDRVSLAAVVGQSGGSLATLYELFGNKQGRSEEHTSELQSLMRISYAVFCLKKKKRTTHRLNKRYRPHSKKLKTGS